MQSMGCPDEYYKHRHGLNATVYEADSTVPFNQLLQSLSASRYGDEQRPLYSAESPVSEAKTWQLGVQDIIPGLVKRQGSSPSKKAESRWPGDFRHQQASSAHVARMRHGVPAAMATSCWGAPEGSMSMTWAPGQCTHPSPFNYVRTTPGDLFSRVKPVQQRDMNPWEQERIHLAERSWGPSAATHVVSPTASRLRSCRPTSCPDLHALSPKERQREQVPRLAQEAERLLLPRQALEAELQRSDSALTCLHLR
eukprot:TRINITY_DN40606_c0_g1_i1.p1 TRINITY_DN40606_c0_g1~~TRINITY_DN40606_c0_g1_i1.p1  ORF type:complete len:253 (-),score=43.38 TRINITY_DN40606_c0_g1_i1:91-849(-)